MRISLPARLATVTLVVVMVAGTAGCGVSGDKAAAPAQPAQPAPQPAPIVVTEHKTAGADPGVLLYLREKRSSAVAHMGHGCAFLARPQGFPKDSQQSCEVPEVPSRSNP